MKERANALVTHTLATPAAPNTAASQLSAALSLKWEVIIPSPEHWANATDGLTALMKADYQEASINLPLIMTKRVCG